MKKSRKMIALALIMCLVLAAVSGCVATPSTGENSHTGGGNGENDPARSAPEGGAALTPPVSKHGDVVELSGYSDVYDFISKLTAQVQYGFTAEESIADGTSKSEPEAANTAEAPVSMENDGADYSGTNVQTAGIDEGDRVKTDGEYIYILKDGVSVVILRAAGADTEKVSEIPLAVTTDASNNGYSENGCEIFVRGDRLVIMKNVYEWSKESENGGRFYRDKSSAKTEIYDITDRAAPKLIKTLAQDGNIYTSRLDGDTVYVVSSYYVYDCEENEEETYIPSVRNDEESSLIAIDDICIPIGCRGTGWSVVSAIDISTGEMKASKATLGSASSVYMSAENIYIVSPEYHNDESEMRIEDQYEVRDYENSSSTSIVKYSTAGGTLGGEKAASVPGYVESQFSLDEYGGNLRMVVTENVHKYTTYYDKKHEFINTKYGDNYQHNSLYVLDTELNIIGSVTGLGEDERVYSARFDGDIGYFVTFRETDPLFAVDLSDPTNPTVLSALKIPGFSEYLHKFTDGRLFGLGMNVNENGNWTEGLKLTMFDITSPADVRELNTAVLKQSWSEALYDHHAVFIDSGKNLIAFPAENEYLFFSYTDDGGFRQEKSLKLDELGTWGIRGMYIGDSFYVCSAGAIIVLDLATLSETARISLF
ncbi:MAG: beta-propeller domain-containing protein [Oscillospiraceae bacterium]|nr:beta-propeller domain-containing protein [Oscillospiraceae bacterium]